MKNILGKAMWARVLFFALCLGICVGSASSAFGQVTVSINTISATTLTIGSAYVWQSKTTNNGTSPTAVTLKYYLNYPDGTRFQVPPKNSPTTIAAGATSTLALQTTTTSVYTSQTGSFTFEADAVDGSGNILANATAALTILPLPSTLIPPRFTDLAVIAGVNAIHHSNMMDCMDMMNMGMSSGAGWADYDGDGFLDLFVTDADGISHLYHNNGNLTFTETTAAAGIPMLMDATGVSWADYDNDGHPDLLVLTVGQPFLFHNNGDGTFTDVSVPSGLSTLSGRGTTGSWGDFDNDGYLDLYIAFYGDCSMGMNIMSEPSHLLHNNGNGTFTDVTNYLGGLTAPQVNGLGFAATWFDYNNDGRLDLYVVNDKGWSHQPNVLWRNDGPDGLGGWKFTDVSSSTGMNLKIAGMGVGVGDYNRDGLMDVVTSNIGFNSLMKNTGATRWAAVARDSGFQRTAVLSSITGQSATSITWGIGLADFNNDGYEDAFMAAGELSNRNDQPNAVLVNNLNAHLTGVNNDGVFLDLSWLSGANDATASRTVALADFDADGWMDALVVNYYNQPPRLYRNEGPADGNANGWLEVRLVGSCQKCAPNSGMSNRDGVGAKVSLVAGGATQYRQIFSGTSLGAGSQVAAHFGLGSATQVSSLTINWPSGQAQTFTNLAINQRLVITEGSSVLGNDPVPARVLSPK